MKQFFFAVITSLLFFACTTSSKKDDKSDSSKNTNQSLISSMQEQLKMFPDSAGLRLQYAFALDSVGLYKQSLQQVDSLIAKDSLNYGFWFAKGNIAEDAHDTIQALQSYSKAAHIYESPDALLALANLYAEKKDNRAILFCSRVKALGLGRDYDASCAFITGVYYARTHNMKDALKYFDICITNSYTYMEAYIEKGLLYFDAGQYDKALAVFQMAANVNNLYADAYYYQARCYEMMNKKDSAILNFKQSLQIDPSLKEAQMHLKALN